ncbi:hypothetical protein JOE40_003809 [Arthrobacter sp. PvP102]|uniref:DUF4232 domain-containing protein n=1 Tax=unclassified Arthrobacter TaxID=235627 RepID=UPI0000526812|nr:MULTISPECIES: DUF4232 domain-containing protein [unclassified Arthrobacter]ABK02025.1 putative secreted lipoprotein [Arthrobacter sp. FB24]MBP1234166.1 hypothetical protein [Arthrobacter sp. PvP103]MBP1239300.1 hypothetical protein [Arthrobacter sp. PvP102]
MRSQPIKNGFAITTAVAAAAFLLTACGPSQPQPQGTSGAASTSSAPASSSAPAASQSPSTPAASPPSSTPASAQQGLCKAANLTVSSDSTGGGAAGSIYSKLILTNSGTEPCLLRGFPGVSLTADANGAPIGAPARQDGSSPVADVLLAPGQAGAADMRYTQAGNYTDCNATQAAGYRVYPPEETASLFLAEPRTACSNEAIELLTIGAFHVR